MRATVSPPAPTHAREPSRSATSSSCSTVGSHEQVLEHAAAAPVRGRGDRGAGARAAAAAGQGLRAGGAEAVLEGRRRAEAFWKERRAAQQQPAASSRLSTPVAKGAEARQAVNARKRRRG